MDNLSNPKVSIITVYYNRAYCVEQSVKSLLSQTFNNFELLLVDDGSADTTIQEFEKFTDPRIRIISHPNMGFTNSIIKAVSMANGKYIAIHGSGDISFPKRIGTLSGFLDANSDYVVAGPRYEVYDEATLEKIEDSPFMGELDFNDFLKYCRLMHGAVMFRKEAYDQVGGYERFLKTSQDWDLFLRFLKIGKGRVLNEILYRQYKRQDAVAARPESYIRVSKVYAFVVLLAKENERRKEILDKAYHKGLNAVISDNNADFQEVYIARLTRLVRKGKHSDFLESTKLFNANKLIFPLKMKYFFWLSVAKFLAATKLNNQKARLVFSKVKLIKDRITATIYKSKYN